MRYRSVTVVMMRQQVMAQQQRVSEPKYQWGGRSKRHVHVKVHKFSLPYFLILYLAILVQ